MKYIVPETELCTLAAQDVLASSPDVDGSGLESGWSDEEDW